MAYRLVFDVDGVICDLWTPVENMLRAEVPLDANAPVYKTYNDYFMLSGKLEDFKRNFKFETYVSDFTMSNLGTKERKVVTSAFANPALFEKPMPMYNQKNTGTPKTSWSHAEVTPQEENGYISRTSFLVWAEWLNLLTETFEVVLHTHVYTTECERARRLWFESQIAPVAPEVKLVIDVGDTKAQLAGSIVVEDNLENLLKSNSIVKVLMNTFHNTHKNDKNQEIFKANYSPNVACVSNFTELQEIVPAWATWLDTCKRGSRISFSEVLERRLK